MRRWGWGFEEVGEGFLAEVFGKDDFVVVAEVFGKGEIDLQKLGDGGALLNGLNDRCGVEVDGSGVEIADAQGIGGGVEGFDVAGDIELDACAGPVFEEGRGGQLLDGTGVGAVEDHGLVELQKVNDKAFFGLAVRGGDLLLLGAGNSNDEVLFFRKAVGAEEVVVELFFPVGFHGGDG